MSRHDHAYRDIFSHPEMMAELLRGIVRHDWIGRADLASLERVNSEHVARHAQRRSGDMVWRVRGRRRWTYIYLMMEFQSRPDAHMAVRIMTYLGLLYEDLRRQRKLVADGRLPAVLPIVLYRGPARWRATRNIADLVEPVSLDLQPYVPSLRYLLLDQRTLLAEGGLPSTNLATLLFRLEHARDEDQMRDALQTLMDRLQGSSSDELQRAFTAWLSNILLHERAPGISIPPVSTLQEIATMIVEKKIDWSLRWRQLGKQEGLKKGRQEGRKKGETLLLQRQLVQRFGSLPQFVLERLACASSAQRAAWALNLLNAPNLDDVFQDL